MNLDYKNQSMIRDVFNQDKYKGNHNKLKISIKMITKVMKCQMLMKEDKCSEMMILR